MADVPARVVIAALIVLAAVVGVSVLTVLFIGRMASQRDQQVPRDPRDGQLEHHQL